MGAPIFSTNQTYTNDINRDVTLTGQVASAAMLDQDGLANLFYTVGESGFYSPTSDETAVGWLETNTTFGDFDGEPKYRTWRNVWASVSTTQKSAHWRMDDAEKKTLIGTQNWELVAGLAGRGDGTAQRQALARRLATAEADACFDGQNLADTDHPGLRYDSATDSYLPLVQSNLALATTFDDAALALAIARITGYHDQAGNHYGNKYALQANLPPTNSRETQAPTPPQFHVYAGRTAITNVQALHQTIGADPSVYAGRYSYSKVEELPDKRWVIQWLNTAADMPGVPAGFVRPYLRKHDGVIVHVAANGEHLDNQRFRMSEINAHSDFGFGPMFWHLIYVGEEP